MIVVDNLCNSNLKCLRRVEALAGRTTTFYNVDIRDKEGLAAVFAGHKVRQPRIAALTARSDCAHVLTHPTLQVDSVIHFAGLKAVGESVAQPLMYYQVNVQGTLNLVEVMQGAVRMASGRATMPCTACPFPSRFIPPQSAFSSIRSRPSVIVP